MAAEAARAFLGMLRLGPSGDQAAVIGFNHQVLPRFALDRQLLTDRTRLERAVEQIGQSIESQSRVEIGLAAAGLELQSPRHRVANDRAIVVLSDGQANPVPGQTAIDTAAQLKDAGIRVLVVGIGPEMAEDVLRAISSGPAHFQRADDPLTLPSVLVDVGKRVVCGG